MKKFRKALAVVMCVVMTLTAAPLSGFVGMEFPDGSGFKKIVESVSAAFDSFSTKAQAATYSGTCGDNLAWSLDTETGVLNIGGTGAMTNYLANAPWYSYRSNIKTVNISSGVTSIGNFAFAQCDRLTSVAIPDSVTIISDYAFHICSSLSNITIPNSVTTIGDEAFYSCDSLTSVTIPDSVTCIGNGAFSDCDSLTSITIPNSVTTIGRGAFCNCDSLTSVTISDSVTTIGEWAFAGCDSLISVTISDSVTAIGNSAFRDCDSLTSVAIPDGVTIIGDSAFDDCDSLTSVTIGNSVASIGSSAFSYCESLTSIAIATNNKYYSSDSYGVLFNKDKTTLIQYPIGNTRTNYAIPDSVTTIGEDAFRYCDSLTSVTIPNSVTTIGNLAFDYCDSLTSITIPDGVTIIGESAFSCCDSLTSVTISDSVTTIGEYAFYHCDDLTSITVDLNNKKYSSDSYGVLFNKDKTTLIQYPIGNTRTNYAIPDSVTTIDDSAFGVCFNLTSVTIPDSVTIIGNYAFHICGSLTSVTIPDSVTIIGDCAFAWCDSLTSITIGNGVTTIGSSAFADCDSLTDVYYTGTQAEWNKISIGPYNEDLTSATIHWPDKVVSENIDYYIKYNDHDYRRVTINATIADSSFSQDSAVYNHDLARLCSQFTVVGYTSGDGNESFKNQVMENALKKLGFDTPVVDLSAERTSVNHFITHKIIIVNGEEYTLIFMGFIGSYYPQWYNNFDPGEGTTHQGFKSAAISMKLELMKYIKDMNLDKSKTKFLITGHSRGAATANLIAADLIKNEQFALKENVYTYAFATPNSTSLPERNNAEYKRIFNFVNPEDFVTKVLPTTWDYGRYGTTFVLPSRTNTSNYSAYYSNMNPVFRMLTNGEDYAPYKNGEEEVYKLVKKFTSTVKSPGDFYNKKMQFNKKDKISPWEFFQIAICPLVGEEDFNTTFFNGLILFATCLLDPTACKTYKEFCNFFLINAVLDKANHMAPAVAKVALSILDPVYGSAINVALATSEGYFEDSHCAETYCAYLMSMSESQVKQTRKAYKNTVNCPVDVEVIDNGTGEVVGRIVNNVVDEKIAAKENAVVMSIDGDSKSFWLPSDGDYEVKLIGNDEGTMDYTVAEIDSDLGEQERINFFDVEITDGKEMTGDVPAEKFILDEYTLKTDSGEETPDQMLDAESGEITITTSVEGDGYITNTLTVKSGDYVTLTAQPVVTAEFVKWVDSNDKTLSTDAEYSFVAKENTSIKAVFTTASGLSIKTPSTTTVNYGDTLILHADFGETVLPEGYTILWTVEGAGFNMAPAADGLTCKMTSVANGNATVKATLVDENGEVVIDAEGNEISDTQELKSNANFWRKIVSFFKNLFRINRIIPE